MNILNNYNTFFELILNLKLYFLLLFVVNFLSFSFFLFYFQFFLFSVFSFLELKMEEFEDEIEQQKVKCLIFDCDIIINTEAILLK